jgi:hypothetical protein
MAAATTPYLINIICLTAVRGIPLQADRYCKAASLWESESFPRRNEGALAERKIWLLASQWPKKQYEKLQDKLFSDCATFLSEKRIKTELGEKFVVRESALVGEWTIRICGSCKFQKGTKAPAPVDEERCPTRLMGGICIEFFVITVVIQTPFVTHVT